MHNSMKNPFLPFILCLSIFLGCEQEDTFQPRQSEYSIEKRAEDEENCSFAEQTNQVHIVEFCGGEFAFHIALELSNQGDFHRIQARATCYKWGGDPLNYVDIAELEVEVDGNVHVWCGIPLAIRVPSDYNKNLVAGEVPFRNHCDDCGINVVTLDYHKHITITGWDDLIKANFRLKLEGCGEHVEEFRTLEIQQ